VCGNWPQKKKKKGKAPGHIWELSSTTPDKGPKLSFRPAPEKPQNLGRRRISLEGGIYIEAHPRGPNYNRGKKKKGERNFPQGEEANSSIRPKTSSRIRKKEKRSKGEHGPS